MWNWITKKNVHCFVFDFVINYYLLINQSLEFQFFLRTVLLGLVNNGLAILLGVLLVFGLLVEVLGGLFGDVDDLVNGVFASFEDLDFNRKSMITSN